MSNLGDELRNWSKEVMEAECQKVMKVFDAECKKATKQLVAKTPEGQIRFELINRRHLISKIRFKLRLKLRKMYGYQISDMLDEKFCQGPFCLHYNINNFPPYSNEQQQCGDFGPEKVIVFYGNKVKSNPNCAKDFIEYWFETFVLNEFEKSFKAEMKGMLASTNWYKSFYYQNIIDVFNCFNIRFTDYEEIFSMLCEKHGLVLKEIEHQHITISI